MVRSRFLPRWPSRPSSERMRCSRAPQPGRGHRSRQRPELRLRQGAIDALSPSGPQMPVVLYLAWGRPQRPQANLIQTLHTVAALGGLGIAVRLYLPPLPSGFDLHRFFGEFGVREPIDLRGVPSLHRRWGGWPFALLHHAELKRADAVYTRVPELSVVLARTGAPHFLEVHDTATLRARGLLPLVAAACRSGSVLGLVTISAAARDVLIEAGAPTGRVHLLPSGVDLRAFAPVPGLGPEDLRPPRALYVGRISRDRGLGLLEQVAAAGYPVRLIGPRDEEPRRDIPGLEVWDPIPHREVAAAYAGAAIALMPYQPELRHADSISPIKLFEAMAAGRVVIASDLPPIRELVIPGVNGLLVPPGAPDAWLEAIRWTEANPDAALAMADAGRRQVEGFSWSERAGRLCALMGIPR